MNRSANGGVHVTPDERADALAAVAVELVGERYAPGRLPKVPEPADIIAERRRILIGADENTKECQ